MRTKLTSQLILAIAISFIFIACGQDEKKADEAKAADSAAAAKPDTAKTAAAPTIPDAVKGAPDLYKVLADSAGIRILEATYKPGDSSVLHSHPDYAVYTLEGGTSEFITKDGKKDVREMKTGNERIVVGDVHSVKNIGKTTEKILLVETTRPTGAAPAANPMDATKIAGNLYKAKADSMGIRILEATYKPGQSSAMHSHPDLAMYVIAGGNTEFTGKDGKKVTMDMKPGTAAIVAADTHSVKNIGKTTMIVLLVEVTRPLK